MRNQKKSRAKVSCAESARLKALARKLLAAIEALDEEHSSKIDFPVDFYEQVKRFEIELITRALTQSHGHQLEGARLIGLNPTTLNAKIKQYNIQVNAFSNGVETPENVKKSVMGGFEQIRVSCGPRAFTKSKRRHTQRATHLGSRE